MTHLYWLKKKATIVTLCPQTMLPSPPGPNNNPLKTHHQCWNVLSSGCNIYRANVGEKVSTSHEKTQQIKPLSESKRVSACSYHRATSSPNCCSPSLTGETDKTLQRPWLPSAPVFARCRQLLMMPTSRAILLFGGFGSGSIGVSLSSCDAGAAACDDECCWCISAVSPPSGHLSLLS